MQASQAITKAQQLVARLQKVGDKLEELVRVQQNYVNIQKIVDDLQRKLQEEESRIQQAVNQLGHEKTKHNVLNFQPIQLNNEGQQFDGINTNLENEIEVNEYSYKKQQFEKDENYNHKNRTNKPVKIEQPVEDVVDRTSETLNTSASQVNLGKAILLIYPTLKIY